MVRFSRSFRWCFVALVLWPAFALAEGDVDQLGKRLDGILDRLSGSGAVLHARVIELPGGRELYARRADEPCIPASNHKLLTSASGLDLFGPDHVFETRLLMKGDDLWIVGCGDPAPGDYRLAAARGLKPTAMLEEWAKALESKGVRRIKGDLVYDDTAFDDMQVNPTWPKEWLLHWYAAPCAGLNFNDNSIDVTVLPAATSQPATYEVMPPVAGIQIANQCMTGAKGSPFIRKRHGGNLFRLGGGCEKRTELQSVPIENPGEFFADALRTQLTARGIQVDGKLRRGKWTFSESEATPIATWRTPITDVLSRINKNSQNLFAECLCKMTGKRFEQLQGRDVPGSWESGGKALRAFLHQVHIDDTALNPVDGSGLSPQNRTSAHMLTSLLIAMYGRPDRDVYWNSLTVAGVDGSLRDRMKAIKGRVRGKTGHIGGVSSCSGYIQTGSGKWLTFSFVYNKCPRRGNEEEPFMALQDEACILLADWPSIPAIAPAPQSTDK